MGATERARCYAVLTAERSRKCERSGVTALASDRGQRCVGFAEQTGGLVEAAAQQVRRRGPADGRVEAPGERGPGHARHPAQLLYRPAADGAGVDRSYGLSDLR